MRIVQYWGAAWELAQAPQGPLNLRVTDDKGDQVSLVSSQLAPWLRLNFGPSLLKTLVKHSLHAWCEDGSSLVSVPVQGFMSRL